jgi:hypothetical protein
VDDLQLLALEAQVRDTVVTDLRGFLDELLRIGTAIYVTTAGSTHHKLPEHAQDTLRGLLVEQLDRMRRYPYREVRQALQHGAQQALATGSYDTGLIGPVVSRISGTLPLDIRAALPALTAGIRDDLHAAAHLARSGPLDRYGDLMSVIATARRAVNRAEQTTTFVIHRAHAEGVQRAIDRAAAGGIEVATLWLAERDACAACLGYAGALAVPGEPFLPVLSVQDPSATVYGPVWGPPLHPHCRCRTEPWFGGLDITPVDLPHALRREAQRSIAAGTAMGSRPARLRAAGRLVQAAGLLIPKTVVKRAQRAVQAGTFER